MPASNRVFTEAQRRLLIAVLNCIIPAEGQFPGAGDLGVADFVEGVMSRNTRLRRLFIEGMAQIEITVARREGKEFQELSSATRDATLRQVESEHPQFFEELVRQTYNGYYTSPRVFQLIGYSPSQSYQPTPFDESLLAKQRQRAPFWRQV
jgi:hypothetical protein